MDEARRDILKLLGASALAVGIPGLAAAQTQLKLTFASGYPPVFSWLKEMQDSFFPTVAKSLEAGGRYRIEWNVATGGTLAKIPAMLEAASNGVTDVAHIHPAFESTKLGPANVGYVTPFSGADHRLATYAMHEMMLKNPRLQKMWEGVNLVYLTNVALDDYAVFSKKPIKSVADLSGLKVGGAGPNLRWIEGSGAVGVVTSGAAAFNDMKSGVFDALISPVILGTNGKFHTIAPHVLLPRTGAVSTVFLTVNRDRWNRLAPEVQAALRKGAEAWQTGYLATIDRLWDESLAQIRKDGATIVELSEPERLKWAKGLPDMAGDWAKELESRGLPGREVIAGHMAYVRSKNGKIVREWDK